MARINQRTIYLPRTVLVFFFLGISFLTRGQNELSILTDSLNRMIDNKATFMAQKEDKIKSLVLLLKDGNSSLEYEYEINLKLFEEYKKFQLDSAIQYIERNLEISRLLRNDKLGNQALLQLSLLYSYAGWYLESERILKNMDVSRLEKELVPDYYDTYATLYSHYGATTSQPSYFKKSNQYIDTLLAIADTSSYRYKSYLANKWIGMGDPDGGEAILLGLLTTVEPQSPEYAMITHDLGVICGVRGDTQQQKIYLTLSAIADEKNSLKDNASIQTLATIYYAEGNIDQALRFSQSAVEDALFCNILFRTSQMSGFYSIINASYQAKETKAKSQLKFYLLLISILTMFLLLSVIYVYRQMKKLSVIKEELSRTNEKLIEFNKGMNTANELLNEKNAQLLEANEIKEQYIGHFFNLCSTYINKLEEYRKTLQKTAMNRPVEELFKLLKSNKLVDAELDELYKNFDTIFLNLYPTFVDDFNALLIEEERVHLRAKDLLNKELRIYALLRLGISDSAKIATFLRCSLSTVYNYRTKMRNKAVVSRDEFENIVMRIGTIRKKGEV